MHLKKYIFLLFLCLSCLLLLFAAFGYPLFGGDSICFVPAAYYISHGQGLVNLLYDAKIDTVHHSFLFYPPLFPYVVAWISKTLPDSCNIYHVALGIINVATMLVLVFAVLKAAGINAATRTTKSNVLFVVLWFLTLCTFQDISTGRPEILAKLILALLLLNNVYRTRLSHELNGMLAFLAVINSPVSSFYIVVIIAGLYVWHREYRQVPRVALGFGLGAAAFVALYPYTVSQLTSGMQQHAHNVIFTRNDKASIRIFALHHIVNPVATFGIGIFLLAVVICLQKIRERKDVLFFFAVLMALCAYFTFKILALSYNLYVLSPVMLFVIFAHFMQQAHGELPAVRRLTIALIMLAGGALGIIRRTVVFADCYSRLYSSARVKEEVDRLAPGSASIGLSYSLFPMGLPYKNVHVAEEGVVKSGTYDYIILQQNYTTFKPVTLPVTN